jgi:hypothetical protein
MNYASVVFVAFVLLASVWYFVWGKKHYAGPPVQDDEILEQRLAQHHEHHQDREHVL